MIKYETVIRGKFLYSGRKSVAGVLESLRDEIGYITELQDAGCEFDFSGSEDDYIYIRTDDPKVAEKFEMYETEGDLNETT